MEDYFFFSRNTKEIMKFAFTNIIQHIISRNDSNRVQYKI